jgi:3-oxoacyl-[acyl-carrier protein] reductase
MSNETRTAIVTGASKGIGAALAGRLAADGFQTVVNYASSAVEAQEVVAAIEAAGGRAMAIRANVADSVAVRMLFDQAEAEFGPVDVLVNNAGIIKVSPLAEVDDDDYQRLVAVNLTGTSTACAKAPGECGTAVASSTSRQASSVTTFPPTASTWRPRRR